MLHIKIKSESLPEREYVHFMYKGTPITIDRVWRKYEDEIVLEAIKLEPQNFECKEKVAIEPKIKEETIIEAGSISEKEDKVKEQKKVKISSKKNK